MKKFKILKTAAFLAVVALAGHALAQPNNNRPATISIPVTFYDFRSDRSNPEFEQPHMGGHRQGLVENYLDADNKPVAAAPRDGDMAQGVRFWFRDNSRLNSYAMWNRAHPGGVARDNGESNYLRRFRPIYMHRTGGNYTVPPPLRHQSLPDNAEATNAGWREGSAHTRWMRNAYTVAEATINGAPYSIDTAYKNIVFNEQLTFNLVQGRTDGMYEFSRRGNNAFFPLNGRGFGNEWNFINGNNSTRNFAFTMEMEFQFQVSPGMVFNFEGDDDVWVFIDNQLVLDLGGIHEPVSGNFNLDQLFPGQVGQYKILRVFYAERHSEGSNIWIQTNIVAPPSSMDISTTGNSGGGIVTGTLDKPADSTITLYSVVYDDHGQILIPPQYDCNHVTWMINNQAVWTGCSYTIADSVAGVLNITTVYNDRQNPPVTKNVTMNVRALPPVYITIQRTADATHRPMRNGRPISDDIYFNPGESETIVYAALRDKYGNFTGFAAAVPQTTPNNWYSNGAAQWTPADPEVATMHPNSGPSVTVRKEFRGEGTESEIIVQYQACLAGRTPPCVTLADTVSVGSRSTGDAFVGPNPFIPGVTSVYDTYRDTPRTIEFYRPAIENSGGGSGRGVLIAVDAPKPLTVNPSGKIGPKGGRPYGQILIYDAVGNIVARESLYESAGAKRSYAFVWDGKNTKGRYVGPGTYLVRVTGKDEESTTFTQQRKIGVTR